MFGANDNITKKVTKLTANDSMDVKKYISRSNNYLKKNNCLKKMKELQSIPTDKITMDKQQEYDTLLRYIMTT